MSTIDHIVFDIGKVLLHWDAELIYVDLIPDKAERQHFLTHLCSPEWNLEQDRGRPWEEAENELIAEHPDKADLIRAFRKNWVKSVPHPIEGTREIMAGLINAGHDVTMLTNFNQHTYREAEEKFPFLLKPRGVTVSGDVKLIKPDPAIYNHHAAEFDLKPENTLFIDDSEKNVAGAKACGWQAVLFESAEKLERDLSGHGVL